MAMISLCSCGSSTEQEQSSARFRQPSHTFVAV
nr:MAG TPA: zinc finger protein [Caudoviricetes sp.]